MSENNLLIAFFCCQSQVMKMILVEYHFCSYKHLSCVILFVGLWRAVFLCDSLQGPKTQDHKHGCADNACHLNSLCLLREYRV